MCVADPKKVVVLSTTFLLCLAQSIKQLANKVDSRPESNDRTARSDGHASIHTSSEGSQNTPPSRKAEPDSHTWDMEIIETYAESVSGGKQTYLPPSEAPSIPSTPSLATISCALESYGRISVDSKESGVDDIQTGQLWLHIKAQRVAKEEEAIAAGRRIQREIRARCCKCNRQTDFLYENCSEVGCGHSKCPTCF